MAINSITRRTSDGTAAAAALEIYTSARNVSIKSIQISLAAATASTFGIGIAAAQGVTPTAPVALLSEDRTRAASATSTAVAWGTGPTVPAQFYRKVYFAATIGLSQKFTFDGLALNVGESLVVWNVGTNGVADVEIVVSE